MLWDTLSPDTTYQVKARSGRHTIRATTSKDSVTLTRARAGKTYTVAVRARTQEGNTAWTTWAEPITIPAPPKPVRRVNASGGNATLTVDITPREPLPADATYEVTLISRGDSNPITLTTNATNVLFEGIPQGRYRAQVRVVNNEYASKPKTSHTTQVL